MLVLSRKPGETLVIGKVEVTVIASSKGRVTLSINAPADVLVLRKELSDGKEDRGA